MDSLVEPGHYLSQTVFDAEMRQVFGRKWILAAVRPMLARNRDFRTLEIAGIPIILQNLGGKVRAFANVCRHRLARIHTEEFGSRPLICPYHNWSYDDQGVLHSVPRNATLFGFTRNEMCELKLKEFAVETVGALVFVNLAAEPPPLSEQFDPALLEVLRTATDAMDDDYIYTRYGVEFNWKLGMENIKDPLHVACLHRDSFPQDIKVALDASPAHEPPGGAPRRHVALTQASTMGDVPITPGASHPWKDLVTSLDSKGFYRSIHLFPNVNLMIVDGASFSIQIYNPISPGVTEMQMLVALTRPLQSLPYKPAVLWEHLKSDMTVLQEDVDCLERLQAGLHAAPFGITHGVYEAAIMDFHAAYLGALEEAA